jgi:hypothetical protein
LRHENTEFPENRNLQFMLLTLNLTHRVDAVLSTNPSIAPFTGVTEAVHMLAAVEQVAVQESEQEEQSRLTYGPDQPSQSVLLVRFPSALERFWSCGNPNGERQACQDFRSSSLALRSGPHCHPFQLGGQSGVVTCQAHGLQNQVRSAPSIVSW